MSDTIKLMRNNSELKALVDEMLDLSEKYDALEDAGLKQSKLINAARNDLMTKANAIKAKLSELNISSAIVVGSKGAFFVDRDGMRDVTLIEEGE